MPATAGGCSGSASASREEEGQRKQPHQKRGVAICVPIVRTPPRRDAFGRIDEDAVIDVGVPHAAQEVSVVEEGWEGVDEGEPFQEANECGMVREVCVCGDEDEKGDDDGGGAPRRPRLPPSSSRGISLIILARYYLD